MGVESIRGTWILRLGGDSSQPMRINGRTHFTDKESLQIDMAWVEQSVQNSNQKSVQVWKYITDKLRMANGSERTSESIRCQWKRTSKDFHEYLADKKEVLNRWCSPGCDEQQIEVKINDL